MFLLGLEHGMTVGDIQTGWQGPASACLRHTRRDSSRKGLTNTRKGQRGRWGGVEWGGRAAGGAEAKVEGVTRPLLLHGPLATGQEVQYCNWSPLARGVPFSDP